MSEIKLRDITQDEWDKYNWIDVTTYGDANRIFIRGSKITRPPNDGFVYFPDNEPGLEVEQWRRAQTPIDPLGDR